MSPLPVVVPAIGRNALGQPVVLKWGRVGGLTLRAGDRLVLGPARGARLCLLVPRGYGHPTLGRARFGKLFAEPGGHPASPLRWSVEGAVEGVARSLGALVLDGGGWVACVDLGGRAGVREGEGEGLAAALRGLPPGARVGLGRDAAEAAALLAWAAPGEAILPAELPAPAVEAGATILPGPWGAAPAGEGVPPAAGAAARPARAGAAAAAPLPGPSGATPGLRGQQLSLFSASRFRRAG